MEFFPQSIAGVFEVLPKRHGDARGYFAETFRRDAFQSAGMVSDFVQDNQSSSRAPGTVRGLHFQIEPFAQTKLVSVLHGAVLDVAVDIRRGSPTFGAHVAVTLSAERGNQLYVPVGFAHGYCTLQPDTVVCYKVDKRYAPECDRGIFWADPALGIDWPVSIAEASLSDKDLRAPKLSDAAELF